MLQVKRRLGSEQKMLDDEMEKQAKLQKDVDRWNAYQDNLNKLKQMQGKMLWIRCGLKEAEAHAAAAKWTAQKEACKVLKTRRREAEAQEKPLEEARCK